MNSDYLDGYDDGRKLGRIEGHVVTVAIGLLVLLILFFTRATP